MKPSKEVVEKLVQEVDQDKSGQIGKGEFLALMRKYREREIELCEGIFASKDTDQSGSCGIAEMTEVFAELGYHLAEEVVRDIVEEKGMKVQGDFLFEDFWRVLMVFRSREGFSPQEIKEFYEAFGRYDKGAKGEITALELGRVMRWLGYSMTLDTQKSLVAKIDVDESGFLDKVEFMKLMRSMREDELKRLQVQFDRYDRDSSGSLSTEGPELRDVLLGMGYVPTKQMIREAVAASHPAREGAEKATEIDFVGFTQMMKKYRGLQVEIFRQNCGFPDREVQRLKGKFGKYDRDHSGELERAEIVRLLEEIFPKARSSEQENNRIKRLLEDSDKDGSGTLSFQDFLVMMPILRRERRGVYEEGGGRDHGDGIHQGGGRAVQGDLQLLGQVQVRGTLVRGGAHHAAGGGPLERGADQGARGHPLSVRRGREP